jgi:hypothetical protein
MAVFFGSVDSLVDHKGQSQSSQSGNWVAPATHSHIERCTLAIQVWFVCSSTKHWAIHGIQVAME